jgi:hypothetical protein
LASFLEDPRLPVVLEYLEAGAQCPTCTFNPDRKSRLDETDGLPPLDALERLGKTARAVGGLKALSGRHQEALTIFLSLYSLGSHLEEEGSLTLGYLGFSLRRKLALPALRDLKAMNPPRSVLVEMISYFRKRPRPLVKKKFFMVTSRQEFENWIAEARAHPERVARDLQLSMTTTGPEFHFRESHNGEPSPRTDEIRAWCEFLSCPQIDGLLEEARWFFDQYLAAASPGRHGAPAVWEIQKAARKSTNPFVRVCLPAFARTFLWERDLERTIQSLLHW